LKRRRWVKVSSGYSLFSAFFIMMFSIFIGLLIVLSLGSVNDMVKDALIGSGVYDVSSNWGSISDPDNVSNVIYIVGYGIPIMGVVNFLYSAVRRQRYDVYEEEE
jgi:hypothetical protein